MDKNVFSLLYIGYDKDSSIWPLTNSCFSRFGSNDSFDSFFVSVLMKNMPSPFIPLTTGGVASYSSRLLLGVESCQSDFILLLHHDFLLSSALNLGQIVQDCSFLSRTGGDYLRVGDELPMPPHGKKVKDMPNVVALPVKEYYRITLQPALWRKDFLMKVLRASSFDSPWDFENFLNFSSTGLAISRSALAFAEIDKSVRGVDFLKKGKINYEAVQEMKKLGLQRPSSYLIESKKEFRSRMRLSSLLFHLPNHWIRFLLFLRHPRAKRC